MVPVSQELLPPLRFSKILLIDPDYLNNPITQKNLDGIINKKTKELFMEADYLVDLKKRFVFFCHSGQRRGICGHKNDCIQILHFVQNNSFISEIQIFTEIQVYFRVTVSFQKGRSL